MRRELAAVAERIQQPCSTDSPFITSAPGERCPVTVYSRPADTQLMSWNRLPDTAVAAVSSALS